MKQKTKSRVIVLASSKGGVGKSTTCACLAAACAARGERVQILDLDPNQTLARWAEAFPQQRLSVEAVSREDFEAALERYGAPGACDMLLIDVAGLYEEALILAIGAADMVLVPSQPSAPDLVEAARIVDDIRAFETRFGTTVPHAVLLTAVHPLATKVFDFVIQEIERLELPRVEPVIFQRTLYRELFLNGQTPHQAEPGGKAAREVDAVLNDALERIKQVATPLRRAS